jgi:3'-phosphoadenosine 5'-phosphosulfate (PAPS) 3'-phosphatase
LRTSSKSIDDDDAAAAAAADKFRKKVLRAIDWGCHQGDSPRHWVLDPIDGTVGFLKGGRAQFTGPQSHKLFIAYDSRLDRSMVV